MNERRSEVIEKSHYLSMTVKDRHHWNGETTESPWIDVERLHLKKTQFKWIQQTYTY